MTQNLPVLTLENGHRYVITAPTIHNQTVRHQSLK